MRKRYRKASHWSPSFKWVARDEALIKEFERDWKGGRGFILRRPRTFLQRSQDTERPKEPDRD